MIMIAVKAIGVADSSNQAFECWQLIEESLSIDKAVHKRNKTRPERERHERVLT